MTPSGSDLPKLLDIRTGDERPPSSDQHSRTNGRILADLFQGPEMPSGRQGLKRLPAGC